MEISRTTCWPAALVLVIAEPKGLESLVVVMIDQDIAVGQEQDAFLALVSHKRQNDLEGGVVFPAPFGHDHGRISGHERWLQWLLMASNWVIARVLFTAVAVIVPRNQFALCWV